jgi:ATP-dependent Clp protease ATP-binding subunit ClpA
MQATHLKRFQVIEDGRLSDSRGRVISFKECLIILTSNVGSHLFARGANSIGFKLHEGDPEAMHDDCMRALVLEEFNSFFRPEFLNRLDKIVVRMPLNVFDLWGASIVRARVPSQLWHDLLYRLEGIVVCCTASMFELWEHVT